MDYINKGTQSFRKLAKKHNEIVKYAKRNKMIESPSVKVKRNGAGTSIEIPAPAKINKASQNTFAAALWQ